MEAEKNKETTLAYYDRHMYFNKKDITKEGEEMFNDYVKGNFMVLGYHFGKAMNDATKPSRRGPGADPDPKREYFEKISA